MQISYKKRSLPGRAAALLSFERLQDVVQMEKEGRDQQTYGDMTHLGNAYGQVSRDLSDRNKAKAGKVRNLKTITSLVLGYLIQLVRMQSKKTMMRGHQKNKSAFTLGQYKVRESTEKGQRQPTKDELLAKDEIRAWVTSSQLYPGSYVW